MVRVGHFPPKSTLVAVELLPLLEEEDEELEPELDDVLLPDPDPAVTTILCKVTADPE